MGKENHMKKLIIGTSLSVMLSSTLFAVSSQSTEIEQLRKDVDALKV
jgi:hypothetical protein